MNHTLIERTAIYSGPPSIADESVWLNLLQHHVKEWRQHYMLESQAVQELEEEHQQILDQAGPMSRSQRAAMIAAQDQQVDKLICVYQARRELIRARQQRELAEL